MTPLPRSIEDYFAMPQSDTRYASVLAAGVAEVVTVPADAKFVQFSATSDFWANIGGIAAVPTIDISDGSASELNPTMRKLSGAGGIGLVAAADCIVQMSFFS